MPAARRRQRDGPVCVVVMGVSGAGKTTIGALLAERLGAVFLDADDLHPPENVRKMSAGIALSDADRAPWLAALAARLAAERRNQQSIVLACSALKQRYRNALRAAWPELEFVWLHGATDLLEARLRQRRSHFAGPQLLASQLHALEAPPDALEVDVSAPPRELVGLILEALGLGEELPTS